VYVRTHTHDHGKLLFSLVITTRIGIFCLGIVRVAADADTMWSIVSDLQASADAVQAVQSFRYGNDDDHVDKFAVGTVVEETRVYQGRAFACRRQIVDIVDENNDHRNKNNNTQQSSPRRVTAAPQRSTDVENSNKEEQQTQTQQQQQQQRQHQIRSVSFSTASTIDRGYFSNTSTLAVVPLMALPLSSDDNADTDSTDFLRSSSSLPCCCELVGTMAFSSSGLVGVVASMCLSCYWNPCNCYNIKQQPHINFIRELQDLAAAAETKMLLRTAASSSAQK
jgi:hypothetical protein